MTGRGRDPERTHHPQRAAACQQLLLNSSFCTARRYEDPNPTLSDGLLRRAHVGRARLQERALARRERPRRRLGTAALARVGKHRARVQRRAWRRKRALWRYREIIG